MPASLSRISQPKPFFTATPPTLKHHDGQHLERHHDLQDERARRLRKPGIMFPAEIRHAHRATRQRRRRQQAFRQAQARRPCASANTNGYCTSDQSAANRSDGSSSLQLRANLFPARPRTAPAESRLRPPAGSSWPRPFTSGPSARPNTTKHTLASAGRPSLPHTSGTAISSRIRQMMVSMLFMVWTSRTPGAPLSASQWTLAIPFVTLPRHFYESGKQRNRRARAVRFHPRHRGRNTSPKINIRRFTPAFRRSRTATCTSATPKASA